MSLTSPSGIIYQATVTRADTQQQETYIGLSEPTFKLRFANHISSFKHQQKAKATTLSSYIWDLKNENINYDNN